MMLVLGTIALGLVLAVVGAYSIVRSEMREGRPLRFGWRLGLSSVQAYLSTWTVIQVAADNLLRGMPLEEQAVQLATVVRQVTLAGIVCWAPLAGLTLLVGIVTARRGDKSALIAPLVAAATYAVALIAVMMSGWLTGTLG